MSGEQRRENNLHNLKSMGTHRISWLVVLAWLLVACSSATPSVSSPASAPTRSEIPPTPALTLAPTNAPTETPTAEKVILLAAEGSQPDLQELLVELSLGENLEFIVQPAITSAEIGPEVRLVVATAPDPGIAGLAAGAPATQFLAVGIPNLEVGPNLSSVGGASQHPDRVGFLGGYLATAITAHWRVGILSSSNNPVAQATLQGFNNGVVYYCGLCRPAYPPYVQYPVAAEVPANAGLVEQQAAVDSLAAQFVNTVFVMGDLMSPDLAAYLARKEIHVISDAFPPVAGDPNWVATVNTGDSLSLIRQLWPALMAGPVGELAETALGLDAVNPAWLSPGRQQYVEEVMRDINEGVIDTGVDGN